MVKFSHIAAMKRQPTGKAVRSVGFPSGFPIPMGKQMIQPMRKLRFPSPERIKRGMRGK